MAKAVLAANGVSSYKNDDHHRWIDLVFLGRQTMGQKSLEIEILKLFKSQLEIHLAQLAHMEDESQLRVRLHTIKGAAFGVGANEVAQLAAKAEKEAAKAEAEAPAEEAAAEEAPAEEAAAEEEKSE